MITFCLPVVRHGLTHIGLLSKTLRPHHLFHTAVHTARMPIRHAPKLLNKAKISTGLVCKAMAPLMLGGLLTGTTGPIVDGVVNLDSPPAQAVSFTPAARMPSFFSGGAYPGAAFGSAWKPGSGDPSYPPARPSDLPDLRLLVALGADPIGDPTAGGHSNVHADDPVTTPLPLPSAPVDEPSSVFVLSAAAGLLLLLRSYRMQLWRKCGLVRAARGARFR